MRSLRHRLLLFTGLALVGFGGLRVASGQEGKPAEPPKEPPAAKPGLDKILDELSKLDPKVLAEHRTKLQAEQNKLNGEIAELKKQVAQRESQAATVKRRIDLLNVLLSKLDNSAAAAKKTAAAMQPASDTPMLKPAEMKAIMVAAKAPKQFLNYEQHVKPIFIEKCAACHNPDKSRGGLIVDSYSSLKQGGGSGEVVIPGDPDSSRLWLLVSHTETPHMPAKQPRMDDARLATIRTWIEQGALENADSKPTVAKKHAVQPMVAQASAASIDGVAPIPTNAPKQLSAPTQRPPSVAALAASPVAPIFAVNGVRQVLIYHATSRELLAALPYSEGEIRHLEFSRDGKWLIAAGGLSGQSGSVIIFDVVSGERLGQVADGYDAVLAAAIDPYRELVAAGGSNRIVRVHDLLTNEIAFEVRAHNDWITAIAFSPDATLMATADRSGGMFVWEAETGRQVHILRGHGGAIHDLAFRPDSNVLASAGADRTVRLWNMDNGSQIKRFNAHGGAVLSIDFSPDSRICTSGADGLVKLWKPDGGGLKTFENLGDWVYETCFVDQGRGAIGGTWTGQLSVFDCESGQRRQQFDTNPAPESPANEALSE